MRKFWCILLPVVMVLSLLASCANVNDPDPQDDPKNGTIDTVSFDGERLLFSISARQDEETTFPAADIYTMGPDVKGQDVTDAVQKKVLARNKEVAEKLDLEIKYVKSMCQVAEVFGDVEKLVLGNAEDAPDLYNNDIKGLSQAMLAGYLWNVSNPKNEDGTSIKSYFDFSDDGWYTDYMRGVTFDQTKQYILAGDYFIDLIRFAWVLLVNIDLFDDAYGSEAYADLSAEITEKMGWTYDDMADYVRMGFVDDHSPYGQAGANDSRIPLCLNPLAKRVFYYTSGLSVVKWSGGAAGKGTPSLRSDREIDDILTLSERFSDLFNQTGVYFIAGSAAQVLQSVTDFMKGNIVMSMTVLGELESADMRSVSFKRGILPYPRYDASAGFHTMVHNQAEVGAILATSGKFTAASAYMQLLNRRSADVLHEYYENSLKFKYADGDEAVLDMIDFVHDTVDSPFEQIMLSNLIARAGKVYEIFDILEQDALYRKSNFRTTYGAQKDAMQLALEGLLTDYQTKLK